jgi:hypothetical protein
MFIWQLPSWPFLALQNLLVWKNELVQKVGAPDLRVYEHGFQSEGCSLLPVLILQIGAVVLDERVRMSSKSLYASFRMSVHSNLMRYLKSRLVLLTIGS